jgi:hypothetical protein
MKGMGICLAYTGPSLLILSDVLCFTSFMLVCFSWMLISLPFHLLVAIQFTWVLTQSALLPVISLPTNISYSIHLYSATVRGHPFISLPLLLSPSTPSIYMYISHTSVTPLYHLQGPHWKSMTLPSESLTTYQRLTHQKSLTFCLSLCLYLKSLRYIGTGPHQEEGWKALLRPGLPSSECDH